ncbi:MAG: GAF domain-containing protein [Gemmatimonadetes bacterium]|nr:GAF domain-containing protein [Gemmatimonadota bacterium]
MVSAASRTTTDLPACARTIAAASPLGPDPTTTASGTPTRLSLSGGSPPPLFGGAGNRNVRARHGAGPPCASGWSARPFAVDDVPVKGVAHLSTSEPAAVHDPERIAALRSSGLLDADAEEAFDRMTRLAVRLLRVPAAFISLVDANRDFYMSAHGFGEPLASARELQGRTFCHYAIESDQPLVINDARADPVYRTVPTVESLGVAAYVGIPLAGPEGHRLGSFCAIDNAPREWTADEVEVLSELAASARREIELRARARAAEEQSARLRELAAELTAQVAENRALAEALQELRDR